MRNECDGYGVDDDVSTMEHGEHTRQNAASSVHNRVLVPTCPSHALQNPLIDVFQKMFTCQNN